MMGEVYKWLLKMIDLFVDDMWDCFKCEVLVDYIVKDFDIIDFVFVLLDEIVIKCEE